MGGCFSDVRGGQQAVGGGGSQLRHQQQEATGGGGHNDAVDFFFKTKGLDVLCTQIELSFSASKLRDRDIMSKSDPMAVVYAKKRDGSLEELGRTEVIMNNLNPIWIEKVSVAYQFEIVQPLIFQVYDVDTKYHNLPVKNLKLKDQEFLGEASCVLSEIVTKQSRSLTLNLHNNHGPGLKNFGTITIHAEETAASRNAVEVVFRCMHLDNKDLFSKSDPFLRISRIVETGGSVPICKTEIVNNNLNPVWKPLCLTMQQYGSKDNPLVVECFDFNDSGDHVLIGQIQKSVAGFERLYREKVGDNFIIPSSHRRGHDKVLKGQLFVESFVEKQLYSFIDYISSGFELNFMVAVDFTASNGNPRSSNSLHYIDPSGRLNAYQQAVVEVGDVIQFYDSDRRFPAWGFGGKTFDGLISHCFNLNGSPNSVEVEGVEGIMAAYANALQNVTLSGPTLFSQVINRAADLAGQSLSYNSRKYFVLLIITDGVLTDLQETKDAIVKASDLPLSILVVGVGNADFKQMEILDADNGQRLESSGGRIATRDIVQFVPMREVHGGQTSVVQSLLEELPGQFLTYMRRRDIKPTNASVPAKVKVEVPNALFKLGVAGYASFGRSVVYFSSTEIVSRHIGGTLETTDGITITLFGLINRSRAHENGFPFQVCSLFAFGFPFDWEQIGDQYFRGESVDRGCPSNVTSVSNGHANSSPGLSFKETRFFDHMLLSSGDYNECTHWQIRSLFDDILSEYGSLVKLNEKDGHQIITDDSLLTECGGTPLNASKKNNRSGVAKSSTSEEAKKFGKDALSNMSTIKKRKANC